MTRLLASIVFLGALAFSLPAAAQGDTLTLRPDVALGRISPAIYGVNYGPWSLISPDMLPRVPETGITHVRFPAGRWGDLNDLTHAQIDLFMTQVRAWGAQPSISVRLEGGTPEAAAALVRYANIERGYEVRDWSIGNEPDLYEDYTVERFNREWRAIALAMRAVDPAIRLLGPELSQFPPTAESTEYLNVRREWLRAFLAANGDLVDVVSIHRYPFPQALGVATTRDELRANAAEWDGLAEQVRAVMRETLGRELPIAITEVNSHWNTVVGGEASPDTLEHAVWWADVLGRLIRQRVELVDYFMLSSHGNLGAFGLFDRYDVRPSFYVYVLYRQLGDQRLAAETSAADVTVTAARRADGALTLMVVHRGGEARRVRLRLSAPLRAGEAQVYRLDAEHDAEPVASARLEDGALWVLPAQSVTLYLLPNAFERE